MRVLEQEYVADFPVAVLEEYPGNPRRGDVEAIAESLDENGFYGAIVVDKATNQILAGNHRFKAALVDGSDSIPVFLVETDSPDHARRINLGDNAYGAKGSTDQDLLLASLKELADLSGSGYTDRDLSDLELLMSVPQSGGGEGKGHLGDPDDEVFWPEIRLKITPDTMDRWRDALDHHAGENDVVKLLALLSEVEAGRAGEDAPATTAAALAVCSDCGRSTWDNDAVGTVDSMIQPNGSKCGGIFERTPRA